MDSNQFAYWLNGFFEIQDASNQTNSGELNRNQVKIIRDHLVLVFNKVTPNYYLDLDIKPSQTYCSSKGSSKLCGVDFQNESGFKPFWSGNPAAMHDMPNSKFPISC